MKRKPENIGTEYNDFANKVGHGKVPGNKMIALITKITLVILIIPNFISHRIIRIWKPKK